METMMTLDNVIRTMNMIEVRGERNLNALLACIQTLEKLKTQLENGEKAVHE